MSRHTHRPMHVSVRAYVGFNAWNVTSSGATIQSALDFTMSAQGGSENLAELYPIVGACASVYGDRDASSHGAYSTFLASVQQNYPAHPWFFWDQPLSDSGSKRTRARTRARIVASMFHSAWPTGYFLWRRPLHCCMSFSSYKKKISPLRRVFSLARGLLGKTVLCIPSALDLL